MTRDAIYIFIAGFICGVIVCMSVQTVRAHDHPISGKKNAAGEWCCGEGDCFEIPAFMIHEKPEGYAIVLPAGIAGDKPAVSEIIPYSEAMPSPDGQFWRCKRPDGSRRCFFAPPNDS